MKGRKEETQQHASSTETIFGPLGETEDNIRSEEEYLLCIHGGSFWY